MFPAVKEQQKSELSLDRKITRFPHQMQQLLTDLCNSLCNSDHKHFLSGSYNFELQQFLSRSALKKVQRCLARGRYDYRGLLRKTWWNSTMVLIIFIFLRCEMTQRGKFHFQILGHDNFYFILFSLSCLFFLFLDWWGLVFFQHLR